MSTVIAPKATPSTKPPVVLVVEDDEAMRKMCVDLFSRRGLCAEGAPNGPQALNRIRQGQSGSQDPVNFVLSDVRMSREMDGLELLREIRQAAPGVPVLLMTGYGAVQDAVHAMKLGAIDYITKPFERSDLIHKVEAHLPRPERQTTPSATPEAPGMVGRSKVMRRLYERIEASAASHATVLITGESGTGKELVASAIHQKSARRGRPFIPVNCAALPDNLIESELFGHEAGSFTGATRENIGLFRAAEGGTLFLDEVVDMPMSTQAKLLRVLQDHRVRPVGSTREYPVDVRIIAATNLDLTEARNQGTLRHDLFYRLSVIRLHIPPLRERLGDLPLLLDHFFVRLARKHERRIRVVSPEALDFLSRYPWPGNVRELQSVVESAYTFGKGEELLVEDLPDWLLQLDETAARNTLDAGEEADTDADDGQGSEAAATAATTATNAPIASAMGKPVPLALSALEKEALERALLLANGNKSKAAHLLGISRKRLYRMLSDHGLDATE